VYESYVAIHKQLLIYPRRARVFFGQQVVPEEEFRDFLAHFLVMLAHGEPSRHQQYECFVNIDILGRSYQVDLGALVGCLNCTPIEFLNRHATTVYEYGRRNKLEFEFGRISGLSPNKYGVGFIGFPHAKGASDGDRIAYAEMIRSNAALQRYLTDSIFF
jgi:hypothetical protein